MSDADINDQKPQVSGAWVLDWSRDNLGNWFAVLRCGGAVLDLRLAAQLAFYPDELIRQLNAEMSIHFEATA